MFSQNGEKIGSLAGGVKNKLQEIKIDANCSARLLMEMPCHKTF